MIMQTWKQGASAVLKDVRRMYCQMAVKASALMVLSASVSSLVMAQGTNTIQSVTGSVSGGSEVIRIDLAEPLTAVPTGFSIQSPARIALDFPGVSNAMGR